jgi:hypothetical protein
MQTKVLAFILALTVLLPSITNFGSEVKAQPFIPLGPLVTRYDELIPDAFTIYSPQETVYNQSVVFLNFTLQWTGRTGDIGYALDNGVILRVSNITEISERPAPFSRNPAEREIIILGSLTLGNVKRGNHTLTVYHGIQFQGSNQRYEVLAFETVKFAIDAPGIVITQNKGNYSSGDFKLRFVTSEPVNWMGYSIDNFENVTIDGNTTIKGLGNGDHNLTVYAKDGSGNIGSSETIKFTVDIAADKAASKPIDLFPIELILTVFFTTITMTLVAVKMRKIKKRQQNPTAAPV